MISTYDYKLKTYGEHEAVTVELHGLLMNACLAAFQDKQKKLLKQPAFETFADDLPEIASLLLHNRVKNARR